MQQTRNQRQSPADVADSALDAWARGDLEHVLAHFSPEVRLTIHVDDQSLDLGGTVTGRPAVRQKLWHFLDLFTFEVFDVERRDVSGETVNTLVRFTCRHRDSGHELTGRYRHEIVVRDGLIVSVDKFHDAAMLRAFLAMASAA